MTDRTKLFYSKTLFCGIAIHIIIANYFVIFQILVCILSENIIIYIRLYKVNKTVREKKAQGIRQIYYGEFEEKYIYIRLFKG